MPRLLRWLGGLLLAGLLLGGLGAWYAWHTYTAPGPLAALERRLDPLTFARVSRSVIVNLDREAEIQPWFGAELVLIMADGARLTTSRGYRSGLDRVMGRVPRRERD